jgi:glycosyltransferase involved in cell wall biosynthesis
MSMSDLAATSGDRSLYFWHMIQSPHQADLVAALAEASDSRITYVFEEELSSDRRRLGWVPPDFGRARLARVRSDDEVADMVRLLTRHDLSICQGLRANGLVGEAERVMLRSGMRYAVVLEAVEDRGWRGLVRRGLYRRILRHRARAIRFILAIGGSTGRWLQDCGAHDIPIYEFAYFLDPLATAAAAPGGQERFVIGYVGQLIERKRVDLLLDAAAQLEASRPVRLVVVGDGPLRASLERRARRMPEHVEIRWEGVRESADARRLIAGMDCLVLPSRHDGWGAVVSEALLAGVPAVCSDGCGVAGVVQCSGAGGVFPAGDAAGLAALLERIVSAGPYTAEARAQLADWAATCISGAAGAAYLREILEHVDAGAGPRPVAPWRRPAPTAPT